MTKLQEQVAESAGTLRGARTVLRSVTSPNLPMQIYESWIEKAQLHYTLTATNNLFGPLEISWDALEKITDPRSILRAEDNIVRYADLEMPFATARHLSLASYITVSWSIYDRLANVCGRLAGVDKLAQHKKRNPKPYADLLKGEESLGFRVHWQLKKAYTWPLEVTYQIRNWLVHDGFENDAVRFFRGDNIANGFLMHPDAIQLLEKMCNYSADGGKIDRCCLSNVEECWPTGDLKTILRKYHSEIDTMFIGLVKWSVESFVGQIRAFAERDMD